MPKFSKQIISKYIKTDCKRFLALSLYRNKKDQESAKIYEMPEPIVARPGANIFAKVGKKAEELVYDLIGNEFGDKSIKFDNSKRSLERLHSLFDNHLEDKLFLLEAEFVTDNLLESFFNQFGYSTLDFKDELVVSDIRPDIIARVIPNKNEKYFEVLPDARLEKIDEKDNRIMLSIVDIKNTEKSNAGYDAEVILYAMLLTLWLQKNNLSDIYAVTSKNGILPAFFKVNAFTNHYEPLAGSNIIDKYKEVLSCIEYIEHDQVAITLRKIIVEDIIPILLKPTSWEELEWHISKKCGLCDWLAYEPWLSTSNKEKINEKHCHIYALNCNHISQIPFVTNAMRKVLDSERISTLSDIDNTNGSEEIYNKHSKLKIDSSIIPKRAHAILNNVNNKTGKYIYSIPKAYETFTNIFITLNFDPSSRLVSSISSKCHWKEFYSEYDLKDLYNNSKSFPSKVFFTEKGDYDYEQRMLFLFLQQLNEYFEYANSNENNRDPKFIVSNYHIYFWDQTQYQELKKLIGRHIGTILVNDLYKPLIWLFGTEDVLEDFKNIKTPRVSFIKNVIKSNIALDLKFDYTLFEVARTYTQFSKEIPKSFHDPFSDYIPKERLYEIWFESDLDDQDIKDKYRMTARSQVEALQFIAIALQNDLKDLIKGTPTDINFDVFENFRLIKLLPTDSKLWYLHHKLNEEYSFLDSELDSYKEPNELEANYKVITLALLLEEKEKINWMNQFGLTGDLYVYKITEDSKNTKIKDDATYLSVGLLSDNIFLSKTFGYLCWQYGLNCSDHAWALKLKMKNLFQMNIIYFDRINGIIALDFSFKKGSYSEITELLVANNIVNMKKGLYLIENNSYKSSLHTLAYLKAIKTPLVSNTSKEVIRAIGLTSDIKGKKTHPDTMSADILWNADLLHTLNGNYDNIDLKTFYNEVIADEEYPPNNSQMEAILNGILKKLSIIWGPPGTGKTATASLLIKLLLKIMTIKNENKTILLSAFTYQACIELFSKLQLKLDINYAHINFYFIKSKNRREFVKFESIKPNWMNLKVLDTQDSFCELKSELGKSLNVIIAPTAALNGFYNDNLDKNGYKNPKYENIGKFIDFALLDEASQCDVVNSLSVLYGLKKDAQLVILGDHLQMPPIHQVEAPVGIEYYVGSFLEYLLKRHNVKPIMLNTNYRSLESIVRYIETLGYDNLLSTRKVADLTIHDDIKQVSNPYKNNFDNEVLYQLSMDIKHEVVAVTYKDGVSSQANPFEAEIVASLIIEAYNKFYDKNKGNIEDYDDWFWSKGLGVVTPHKAQKVLISRLLYSVFSNVKNKIDKAIDTVEKFQGSQRKFIIVSFGVGDPDVISEEEEFLLNLNRTNVAISRAEDKVIVVISEDLVHHLPDDKEIIKTSKAIKSYVHQYCNNIEKCKIKYEGKSRTINIKYH